VFVIGMEVVVTKFMNVRSRLEAFNFWVVVINIMSVSMTEND
jgi:Kef-type K+ transport system membrane component KefB